jgi:hypothetical protein
MPIHQEDETAAWLRRGLALTAACGTAFAGIAYLRSLHHFRAPFLHFWAWQAAAWLPWTVLLAAHRRTLDWCLRETDRTLLAVRLVLGGVATGLLATVWLRVVSEQISPFLGARDTNMGVFRFFFILWFLVQALLYALVVAWRMLGALPLPAAAARRDAEEAAPPAGCWSARAREPRCWTSPGWCGSSRRTTTPSFTSREGPRAGSGDPSPTWPPSCIPGASSGSTGRR